MEAAFRRRLRSAVRDSRSILHLAGNVRPPSPPPLRPSVQFFFGKFETKAKESGAIWHRMDSSPLGLPPPPPAPLERVRLDPRSGAG